MMATGMNHTSLRIALEEGRVQKFAHEPRRDASVAAYEHHAEDADARTCPGAARRSAAAADRSARRRAVTSTAARALSFKAAPGQQFSTVAILISTKPRRPSTSIAVITD